MFADYGYYLMSLNTFRGCQLNEQDITLWKDNETKEYMEKDWSGNKKWDDLRDLSEEEDVEIRAKETGLSYVKLDGNIGCLVNGAGLAMATMDVIKLYGGEPANFLDVGGGANEEQVQTAFSIILEDPNVKGILVNIFGGIMRCDIIARGVIAATEALSLDVPLVVRLAGTNVDEGKKILAASTLNIHPADDLAEGAQKIVALIGGDE